MKHQYLRNVTTLSFNADQCVGCGRCTEVCPHGVFDMDEGRARIVDKDGCIECGACALNCPVNAIEVNAGTGCALAIIKGWLTGKEPACDYGDGDCC